MKKLDVVGFWVTIIMGIVTMMMMGRGIVTIVVTMMTSRGIVVTMIMTMIVMMV